MSFKIINFDNDQVNIKVLNVSEGASASLVGEGTYKDKNIYLKLFTNCKSQGLLYEKKLYEYLLRDFNKNEDKKNFFIEPLKTFEITYNDSLSYVKYIKNLIKNKTIRTPVTNLYGIITMNNKGINLINIIYNLIVDNDNNYIKILFFNLLYIIYILNIKLKIIHNDLHFNNIIYINEDSNINYDFESIKITLKNNYKLKVFDYDYSYTKEIGINEIIENEICTELYGTCNYITKKDIWTLLVNLILIYTQNKFDDKTEIFLFDIIKTISNDSKYIELFIDTIMKSSKIHTHRLCQIDKDEKTFLDKCGEDFDIYKNLDIKDIIIKYYNKYIKDIITSNENKKETDSESDDIEYYKYQDYHYQRDDDLFYKKYLKYKMKYNNIK